MYNRRKYINHGDVNVFEKDSIFIEDNAIAKADIIFICKLREVDKDGNESWVIKRATLNDGPGNVCEKLGCKEYTHYGYGHIVIGKESLINYLKKYQLLGDDPDTYNSMEFYIKEPYTMNIFITSKLIKNIMDKVLSDNLIDDWCEEIIVKPCYGDKNFSEVLSTGGSVILKKYDDPKEYIISGKSLIVGIKRFLDESDLYTKSIIFTDTLVDLWKVIDDILLDSIIKDILSVARIK